MMSTSATEVCMPEQPQMLSGTPQKANFPSPPKQDTHLKSMRKEGLGASSICEFQQLQRSARLHKAGSHAHLAQPLQAGHCAAASRPPNPAQA